MPVLTVHRMYYSSGPSTVIDFLDNTKFKITLPGHGGWDPQYTEDDVPMRTTDGAVLAYSRIAATMRVMSLLCYGSDWNGVKVNALAVDNILINARNSRIPGNPGIIYAVQETSEAGPDNWKVLGGLYRRIETTMGSTVMNGVLTLHLSKA